MIRFLALSVALLAASAAVADQPSVPAKSGAEVMKEMRLKWLIHDVAPAPDTKKDEIVAVVMDWPLDEVTVTVLASSGGDASLYTTSTFGIIGGIGHETVRRAAIAFVACARKHQALAAPSTDFSYPSRGTVTFFLISAGGTRRVSFRAAQIQERGTPAFDLYARGQAVITELRKVTE